MPCDVIHLLNVFAFRTFIALRQVHPWLLLVCRTIAETVVPAYRSKCSKHVFTQPQLLTLLCLMRYEDGTFREVEVRLAEHAALRQALDLRTVPDYTTVYRFLRRLEDATIQRVLTAVVRRLPRRRGQTVVAIGGTGLTPGARSVRASSSACTIRAACGGAGASG